MEKTCLECQVTKLLDDFHRNKKALDGHLARCKVCICAARRTEYWATPESRQKEITRKSLANTEKCRRDPAYRRAWRAWQHAKQRRAACVPPWMTLNEFMKIAKKAVQKGPLYELDHIVPLKHPLVCGLHVPWNLRVVLKTTNAKKHGTFLVL